MCFYIKKRADINASKMCRDDFFTRLTALLLSTDVGTLKDILSKGVHDSKSGISYG